MAYRQFFSGLAGLLSGAMAAAILVGYLFMISAFVMGLGYLAFATVEEPQKEEIVPRENSFKKFLESALTLLKSDKDLQV